MNTKLENGSTTHAFNSIKELPRLDISTAFDVRPPQPDFVIPGLVAGTVGNIVAPGATGKSWLALLIAAAVVGGPDLLRLFLEKYGKVLIIAAEDPALIVLNRLFTLGDYLNTSQRQALVEHFTIIPALAMGINLRNPTWIDRLCGEGEGFRLIIIDTLSRTHDGDENDRRDAAPIMRNLELLATRTGAAVMFLHHVAKSVALNGQGDAQQAARGSSVWVDEARWVAFLRGMDEKEAKQFGISNELRKQFVRFGVCKQNYGVPMADRWLRRGDGGILLPADFPDESPPPKAFGVGKGLRGVEVTNEVPF